MKDINLRRLTTFGNDDGTGASSEPAEAVDEEEDELNSLLRERRKWLEQKDTDGNGQVFFDKFLKLGKLIQKTEVLIFIQDFLSCTTGRMRTQWWTRTGKMTGHRTR